MASPANPGTGAPPSGGAPSPSPQGGQQGSNPLQILAAITRLAQMLASSSSQTSPESEEIIKQVQNAARKLMPTQQDPRQQSPF